MHLIEFTGSWDEEAVMKSSTETFDSVLDQSAPVPRYTVICIYSHNHTHKKHAHACEEQSRNNNKQ